MNLSSTSRPLLGVSLLAVISLATGAVLWSRPDLWLVEHVVFEGHERATAAELRHLADLRNGTTVWGVEPDAVARSVSRHPWVRDAEVSFEWPDTVRVRIREHRTAAVLHHGDRLLYLSEDGLPFLPVTPGDADYPHVTGIGPELAATHPELPGLAVRDALWLVGELDRRGLVPRPEVSEIAFSESLGFTVHAGSARLSFGHADLPRQVDRLAALAGQGLDPTGPTYVDLAPESVAIVRALSDVPTGG